MCAKKKKNCRWWSFQVSVIQLLGSLPTFGQEGNGWSLKKICLTEKVRYSHRALRVTCGCVSVCVRVSVLYLLPWDRVREYTNYVAVFSTIHLWQFLKFLTFAHCPNYSSPCPLILNFFFLISSNDGKIHQTKFTILTIYKYIVKWY